MFFHLRIFGGEIWSVKKFTWCPLPVACCQKKVGSQTDCVLCTHTLEIRKEGGGC